MDYLILMNCIKTLYLILPQKKYNLINMKNQYIANQSVLFSDMPESIMGQGWMKMNPEINIAHGMLQNLGFLKQ